MFVLTLLYVMDFVITCNLIKLHGVAAELNPLAAELFDCCGFIGLLALKVISYIVFVACYYTVSRIRSQSANLVLAIGLAVNLSCVVVGLLASSS